MTDSERVTNARGMIAKAEKIRTTTRAKENARVNRIYQMILEARLVAGEQWDERPLRIGECIISMHRGEWDSGFAMEIRMGEAVLAIRHYHGGYWDNGASRNGELVLVHIEEKLIPWFVTFMEDQAEKKMHEAETGEAYQNML